MSAPPKFSLAPSRDYDFTVGGDLYEVGCLSWYDGGLVDSLAASTVSALTGLKSIDNIKRTYFGDEREQFIDHDLPAKRLIAEAYRHVEACYRDMTPRKDSSVQTITFDQALVRAHKTLENALYLARRGYVFETALVSRGCLEQIVWAWEAGRVLDEPALFKIDVQRAIGRFKAIYPSTGRLYGELSKYSHFDAELHSLFYTESDGKLATRLADNDTKIIAMQWPFVLADIWLICFESFYRCKVRRLKSITTQGRLRKQRPAISAFISYFGPTLKARGERLFAQPETT